MSSLLMFNRVYRLEIQSVMLEFSTSLLVFNRVHRLEIQSVMLEFFDPSNLLTDTQCIGPALHDNVPLSMTREARRRTDVHPCTKC